MLEQCQECDGEVSSDAEVCPHCGYRLRGREYLMRCKNCKNEVIPVPHPYESVGRFCPICQKQMTMLGCRFFLNFLGGVMILFFILMILAFIAIVYFLMNIH